MRTTVLCFLTCLAACGGGGGGGNTNSKGGCDLRTATPGGYCQDYDKVPAIDPYKTTCTQGNGTWLDAGCPHDNAIGACTDPQGATINWFYVGGVYPDRATYKQACEMSGGTFSDP